MTTHLLPTRGHNPICGADTDNMNADINRVTCDLCITLHDALVNAGEDDSD